MIVVVVVVVKEGTKEWSDSQLVAVYIQDN